MSLKTPFRSNILYSPDTSLDVSGGRDLLDSGAGELKVSSGADNNDKALEADDHTSGIVDLDNVFESNTRKGKPGRPMPRKSLDDPTSKIIDKTQQQILSKPKALEEDALKPSTEIEDAQALEEQEESEDGISTKRDYSKFAKGDIEYLKKLPNSIFKHIAPVLEKQYALQTSYDKVSKELKTFKDDPNHIPETWYDSPDAFTLTPQYKELAYKHTRLTQEAQHWETQLVRIANGQSWNELNFQNGQYYLGQEHPIGTTPAEVKQAELSVQRALSEAVRLQNNVAQQAEGLATDFKVKYEQANSYYKDFGKDHFDKLLPELQPVEAEGKLLLDVLHPSDAKNRLAPLAAKMFSVILRQGAYIQNLINKSKTNTSNANDQLEAGPQTRVKRVSGAGKGAQKGQIDLEELDNEMRG